MTQPSQPASPSELRIAVPPARLTGQLVWIGPMLMVLGAAIGSGELLLEPTAAARYGGTLFWAIPCILITKAMWNEAIGRVAIVTGQNFLEALRSGGPLVSWIPWFWYLVNVVKDFLLRGGIVAIAGLICYDSFGSLPLPAVITPVAEASAERQQMICWALVNYTAIWLVLLLGGYRLAETINTVLCIMFTASLVACALAVAPHAVGELTAGLVPQLPSTSDEALMLIALAGIVMSGSSTVYYSAWTEERGMGLFALVRRTGGRLAGRQFEPACDEEISRMRGWLGVNRLNVAVTYSLGALVCFSTFVLGIAILRPAGVTLRGAQLAPELSLMMTRVVGPWAKPVFYLGTYAAMVSTTIGILDGASRMYTQPLRQFFPRLTGRLSTAAWHRIIMTLMVAGCWLVYAAVPDALKLVVWMGAVDAPLVGVLFVAYGWLARRYVPQAYRRSLLWLVVMAVVGAVYFAAGLYYVGHRLAGT